MAFTKSTTDIVVHQKLSDYPNQDDGLTATQLKEKFDYPAETLQEDLNKVVDELNATTASANVGADKVADSDTSDSNVQAKLEYLYNSIAEAAAKGIPDGTVTRAKMNDDYANTLAIKDGTLQSGLNAEQLNGVNLGELYLGTKYHSSSFANGKLTISVAYGVIGAGQKFSLTIPNNYVDSTTNTLYIGTNLIGTLPQGLVANSYVDLLYTGKGLIQVPTDYAIGTITFSASSSSSTYSVTVNLGFKPSCVIATGDPYSYASIAILDTIKNILTGDFEYVRNDTGFTLSCRGISQTMIVSYIAFR